MAKIIRASVLVTLALALTALAFAQKLPKYDKTAEVKINTVVDDVKTTTADNGQARIYLVVKDGGQSIDVYVAPKAFIDDMTAEFAKGEKVEITGVKSQDGDKTLMLAREIVQGNNTLVLRDKTGEPVWAWMEKKNSTAEGK